MPAADQDQEVLIAITVGIIILFVIAALIVFMFLYYQRKKFQHRGQIDELEKKFSEALFRSQLEIQEQTFNDISQEIHDNVGQMLSLARIQMNIMTESNNMDPGIMQDVKENVGKAMGDLRDIAKSLNSQRIRALAIHDCVAQETERINKTAQSIFNVSTNGEVCEIEEKKKLILFRIIQESMQNCLKHAGASHIAINFNYTQPGLIVSIEDNGCGFDVNTPNMYTGGLGLSNMRARAMLAGGSADVESKLNEGTIITIKMPYG